MTPVGSYLHSGSGYFTYDQGGNVSEWNETLIGTARGVRGGEFLDKNTRLASSVRGDRNGASNFTGFRIAMIPGGYVPEPSTGLLVIAGLLGFGGWRRVRD